MKQEKRRFIRIPFDATVHMVNAREKWQERLLDLSLKGALVAKPAGWISGPGQRYDLEIPLDEGDVVIRMQARVAHIDSGRVGFVCENIDVDSITHLRRLVELNVGNDELLQRELAELGK